MRGGGTRRAAARVRRSGVPGVGSVRRRLVAVGGARLRDPVLPALPFGARAPTVTALARSMDARGCTVAGGRGAALLLVHPVVVSVRVRCRQRPESVWSAWMPGAGERPRRARSFVGRPARRSGAAEIWLKAGIVHRLEADARYRRNQPFSFLGGGFPSASRRLPASRLPIPLICISAATLPSRGRASSFSQL